jgi:hypothetical protein
LFEQFFEYLSAQKVRTPKGLDWIKSKYLTLTQLELMLEMQALRQMHCTMWLESVREIVSAEDSTVKFLVTDNPVTAYNAALPPDARACRYPDDPPASLNGTQTLFALDESHCLIFTNLSYAKSPTDVDPVAPRENVRYFGQTIARTDALIRTRKLTDQEVTAINHVLKSRAHRYVAAGEKSWLYPESAGPIDWKSVSNVLLPRHNELWHFGGEIYVGYQDGSTLYQDAFGRTTEAHTYFKKEKPNRQWEANDRCGCGSGRKFKRCCFGLPTEDRNSWEEYSIRDRNHMLCNAVRDILGLDKGKDWPDIQRELSDDQVKKIHETVTALWSPGTNLATLLPRQDEGILRAVFMGIVDPRTILQSVVAWLIAFDEIVIVNPFVNASHIRPEFSPIENPAHYKEQTLKNVLTLLTLEPFIDGGLIHLVPDPGDFGAEFGQAIIAMAKERADSWAPDPKDMESLRKMLLDDQKRALFRMSDETLQETIRRSSPDLDVSEVEVMSRYLKAKLAKDPLALLQPFEQDEKSASMIVTRGMSLELALFLAQLTGSAVYTDNLAQWKQLHAHALSSVKQLTRSPWTSFAQKLGTIDWDLEVRPEQLGPIRMSVKLRSMRNMLQQLWRTLRLQGLVLNVPGAVQELTRSLEKAAATMTKQWAEQASETRFKAKLKASIPQGGFRRTTVERLLLIFGRSRYMRVVPVAFLVPEPKLPDDFADGAEQQDN